MNEKIAPHLEELTRALGDIDKTGIRAEFEKLLAFRVPPDVAKESLLRKFGGRPQRQTLKVKDLSPNQKNLELTGRILDLSEKPLRPAKADAESKPSILYTGILADETGSVMFSSWKKLPCGAGGVIKIKNAYTRVWQNRVRLSIKDHSVVSEMPDGTLPSLEELSGSPVKKLWNVSSLDLSVSATACVLQLSHREVVVKGRPATVISGVLADETARLPFTSWVSLPGIDIGSIIRFEAAGVRMFRGVPSINFLGETLISIVEPSETEKLAFSSESVKMDPAPLKMREIESRDGMFDVLTSGNAVSVRPGSGVITRCPECSRVIQKGSCRVHGKVEGVRDMRVKAILDDGTGTVSVMFNRELSELIYGKTLEEAETLLYSDISKDAVFEDLRRILTGRFLAVRGNASKTEYGVSFVAERVWVPEDDLAVRVVELLHRLDLVGKAGAPSPELGINREVEDLA